MAENTTARVLRPATQKAVVTQGTIQCPQCRNRFWATIVHSSQTEGRDTDFCPRYGGYNPLPHMVHVCPKCLHVGVAGEFATAPPAVDPSVPGGSEERLSGSQKFTRLAQRMEAAAKVATAAHAYQRAAWCARHIEQDWETEEKCMKEAVRLFLAALAGDPTKLEEGIDGPRAAAVAQARTTYLIGELYRRTGETVRAWTTYDQALAKVRGVEVEYGPDEDTVWLGNLAERQMAAPVEDMALVDGEWTDWESEGGGEEDWED